MILLIGLVYLIIFVSPIIVGITLSAIGMKKHVNCINIAGLSLNIVAFLLYIIKIIIILNR